MTAIDPRILEQLSAWMDGELPADEARFLQRRLHNDVALREQWERWQLASACLRGQPVRPMPRELPARIADATAAAANDAESRRPRMAWLASAAALVVAAALLPGMLAVDTVGPAPPSTAVARMPAPAPVSPATQIAADPGPPMSPLPSVRDFPLVDRGGQGWPRSPLLADPRPRGGLLVSSELPATAPPDAGRRPTPATAEAKAGNE